MKLSKAEAGRLGAQKSREIMAEKTLLRRMVYEAEPKLCQCCSSPLPYEKRNGKYCSRSCSASVNNSLFPKLTADVEDVECKWCKKVFTANRDDERQYCSNTCRQSERKYNSTKGIIEGRCSDRKLLKRYLVSTVGAVCVTCRNDVWMGQPIPLEVDHIDGDTGNNFPANLRLLCPNCHAQTPTAKGKNRGRGRRSRGLPVH